MTRRARLVVFLAGAGGLAALLLWAISGLPSFGNYQGPYGNVLNHVAVGARHATNVVSAVTFDYRGIDTLMEEFIFFTAVIGTTLLLRAQLAEEEEPADDDATDRRTPAMSDAVRLGGFVMTGVTFLFGVYMVLHGHLTPGGGFQGGIVVGTGVLTVYLASEYETFLRVSSPTVLDVVEPAGAGGYILVGLGGLVGGASFLYNFLPLGVTGQLPSAGMIPVLNAAVGVEVGAGIALIVAEFLEQTLQVRKKQQTA